MANTTEERRQARSADPQEALRLQLVSVCRSAGIEAAVLANEDGLAIVHVGDSALCSELAAIVPIVAEQRTMPPNTSLGAGELHVRPMRFEGQSLYLAVCSEGVRVAAFAGDVQGYLQTASEGVTRILRAA